MKIYVIVNMVPDKVTIYAFDPEELVESEYSTLLKCHRQFGNAANNTEDVDQAINWAFEFLEKHSDHEIFNDIDVSSPFNVEAGQFIYIGFLQ